MATWRYKFASGSAGILGGTTAIFMIVLIVCFIPFLTIWALNTLSEAGNMGWHISHGIKSYIAVYALWLVINTKVKTGE